MSIETSIQDHIYSTYDTVAVATSGNSLHIGQNVYGGSEDTPICSRSSYRSKQLSVYPKGTKDICNDCKRIYHEIRKIGLDRIPASTDEVTEMHTRNAIRTSIPTRFLEKDKLQKYVTWHDNEKFYIGHKNNVPSSVSEVKLNTRSKAEKLPKYTAIPIAYGQTPRVPRGVLTPFDINTDAIVLWENVSENPYVEATIKSPP